MKPYLSWILSFVLVAVLNGDVKGQVKTVYCDSATIWKMVRDNSCSYFMNGERDGCRKGNIQYLDTSTLPANQYLKYVGTTIKPSVSYKDHVVALYVIKGDTGEPICIPALRRDSQTIPFQYAQYIDVRTKKYYTKGGGGASGEFPYSFYKYLTFDGKEFNSNIHVIK